MKTQNLPKGFKNTIEALIGEESPLFFDALGEVSPVSVRQNPLKPKKEWENATPILWCATGNYLAERPLFTADPHFHAGNYYVQEASSMFLEQFVKENIANDAAVTALDLCAAPGGKSTHLVALLHQESTVFCNEVIPKRNAVLCENITKWGTANVIVTQNEAGDFLPLQNFFDVVLIDAPCSGEGMFRKDARAIEEWSEKNVEICSLRQAEILENIVGSLRENGILIYSTCTFEKAENEEKIKWLCEEKGMEEIRIKAAIPEGVVVAEHGYRFYPHKVKGEGFYIACVRKKKPFTAPSFDIKNYKKQVQAFTYKQVPAALSSIIENAERFKWFQFKNQYTFIEESAWQKLLTAEKFLNIKQAGTAVGEEKGKDIQLNHAAAISVNRNTHLPQIELSKSDALKFLKNESMHIEAPKGWLAVVFGNTCLGWAKSTGTRLNNHYPKEWKIRMDV